MPQPAKSNRPGGTPTGGGQTVAPHSTAAAATREDRWPPNRNPTGAAPTSINLSGRGARAQRATTVQPRKGAGWVYWPFRVVVSAAGVLLFNQAVFAGQFLSGTFGALHTHRENATVAGIVVLAAALAAVPIRWPGRGPSWPILACLGLFGLIALQIMLGFARALTVHVPLGVAIILLAVLLVIWAWRPHHLPVEPTAGQPTADAAAAAPGDRS